MKQITKPGMINGVLWLAFMLALGSSISHLAWTFGTLEPAGHEWRGWIPAVAVDAGLAALAYTIQQRKRAKRPTLFLWIGVAGFALISALANLYHALSVETHGQTTLAAITSVDWLQLVKAVVLSATLPGLVLYLGEIVSSDDAQAVAKTEQETARLKAKEERELRLREQQTDNEAKRLALEAEKLQRSNEQQATLSEQSSEVSDAKSEEVTCDECGRTFKNRFAKAGHKCPAKEAERLNGKVHP